jgi:hypothetical protein
LNVFRRLCPVRTCTFLHCQICSWRHIVLRFQEISVASPPKDLFIFLYCQIRCWTKIVLSKLSKISGGSAPKTLTKSSPNHFLATRHGGRKDQDLGSPMKNPGYGPDRYESTWRAWYWYK